MEPSAQTASAHKPGRGKVYDSITETVGDTPIVRFDRIAKEKGIGDDRLFYLATAPEFFASIIENLGGQGMNENGDARIRRYFSGSKRATRPSFVLANVWIGSGRSVAGVQRACCVRGRRFRRRWPA